MNIDDKIKDFANLSLISYKNKEEINKQYQIRPYYFTDPFCVFYNCSDVPQYYTHSIDSQMYVCIYNNSLLIVFRGTDSKRDILTCLNFMQVKMKIDNIKSNYPMVHTGFYNQFKSLKTDIDKIIREYQKEDYNKEVIFCGHSLGGALATIASLQYGCDFPDLKINCITFGSPRVGNALFVEYFNKVVNISYRFVNKKDPITIIPSSLTYKHVAGVNIDNDINSVSLWCIIKNYVLNIFGYGYPILKDHRCTEYCSNIVYI